jgi:hypothetical protein
MHSASHTHIYTRTHTHRVDKNRIYYIYTVYDYMFSDLPAKNTGYTYIVLANPTHIYTHTPTHTHTHAQTHTDRRVETGLQLAS